MVHNLKLVSSRQMVHKLLLAGVNDGNHSESLKNGIWETAY